MTDRDEAYAALENAIDKLVKFGDPSASGMACDAVLLVGIQDVDDDGDRCGWVNVYPRHGCQPTYITDGLIHGAIERLRKSRDEASDDD